MVILGGGFAGLSAALALDSRRYDVTLIDRSPAFEWLPNIHELLSRVKTPEALRLPLTTILKGRGHLFLQDSVTSIRPAEGRVCTEGRPEGLEYDALFVALGGVDSTRGVEGVLEHALPFKSVDQCERIGRRLDRLAAREEGGRVVVVGGGLEGVEALGEILRRHREHPIEVTLVEAGEQLLGDAPAALDRHIRELCREYAVRFETGIAVARIEAAAVVLADGRRLDSDCTIWTGGPTAPELLTDAGLAPPGAWASVEETLQSREHPEIFVAGDAAGLPKPLAKQAYHAIDMGAWAARNAQRWLRGRRLGPFRPAPKPMLVSFGDLSCFLVAGRLAVAGPLLAAGKEAVFELTMAQLDSRAAADRAPEIGRRALLAADRLLWPTCSSASALLRQPRVSLLSVA